MMAMWRILSDVRTVIHHKRFSHLRLALAIHPNPTTKIGINTCIVKFTLLNNYIILRGRLITADGNLKKI
jgi:hypothetical protein